MKYLWLKVMAISVLFVLVLTSCNLPLVKANSATATSNPLPALSTVANTAALTVSTVAHSQVPVDPTYMLDQIATDCNTGARMQAGSSQLITSGCDYWNREWLERPASSDTSTYVPALDILWSQAGKSEPWIYLKLKVNDLSNMPQGYKAGFELDSNLDSRGNFLLLVNQPTSTSWTTDGVQVWQDVNLDVGGSKPFAYDANGGNGYETKLFDSGAGSDPDLAWARISPKDPNIIEFAFKASMLPNPNVFGWWAWAGLENVTPGKFELVDSDQDPATWNVDNTCSWIFGEKPSAGQLANLCAVIQPTATPTSTALPGRRATPTPVYQPPR
jgi:hypothetical protein